MLVNETTGQLIPQVYDPSTNTFVPISGNSDGTTHTTQPTYDLAPIYEAGGYKYFCEAAPGTALTTAAWKITRIKTTDGQVSYAGTTGAWGLFNQVATPSGLSALVYSQL
jgi:hypothetical protein